MRGLPIPFRPWFNYSANRPPPEILAPVMQQPLTPFFKNTQLLASPNNANLFRPKFERVVESDRQRIVWNRVEDKENNKVGTAPHAPVKPPLPYRPVGDKMQFNPALLDRECVNLTLSEEKLDVVGLGKPHSLVSHQSDLDKLFEPILREFSCMVFIVFSAPEAEVSRGEVLEQGLLWKHWTYPLRRADEIPAALPPHRRRELRREEQR